MNRLIKSTAASAALLLLSGCASALKADLHGTLPDRGTFVLAEAGGGSPAVAQGVRAGLIAHGLIEGRGGTYLVQAGFAQRNLSSGMTVSTAPREWLKAPIRGAGHVAQFNVTLTRVSDGSELFRATVAKRNARIDPRTTQQLVDAVFSWIRKDLRAANQR